MVTIIHIQNEWIHFVSPQVFTEYNTWLIWGWSGYYSSRNFKRYFLLPLQIRVGNDKNSAGLFSCTGWKIFTLPLYAKYITKLLRLFCSAVIYPWTCPYHLCLCRLDAKTLANVCWPVAISTLTKRVSLWPCTRDQSRYYCKSTKISFVSNWSDCPISNQLESPFSLLQRVRERARSAQELQWSVKNHSQKITLCTAAE